MDAIQKEIEKSKDDIIKALDCCLPGGNCDDCPYEETCFSNPETIREGLFADIIKLLEKVP